MLLSADQVVEVSSPVSKLLDSGSDATTFQSSLRKFKKVLSGSAIVPAKYELATCENRVTIDYLLHDDKDDDGRYRLAKVLLDEEVSNTFDIALIDAPPRLTEVVPVVCAKIPLR